MLALNLASGHALVAAAMAVVFAVDWRELHRAPYEPDAAPLTLQEEITHTAVVLAAAVLFIVGCLH